MYPGGWTGLHDPVMPDEVEKHLHIVPGCTIVDATIGLGGHAVRFLKRGAHVVGVDRDPEALEIARSRLARWEDQAVLVQGDFRSLRDILASLGAHHPDGVFMDLGVSSLQLGRPERGFSFQQDGPLDMRMDPESPTTAFDLVNKLPEKELADLLWNLGEERLSRRIARRIVQYRDRSPLRSTKELASLVARCYPKGRRRIHPATRTFQALRMAVNEEDGALREGLKAACDVLPSGGRLCVISFHSLEDRVVKHSFRAWQQAGCLQLLTPKPVRPSPEEVKANPRARSAKLRAAQVREVAPR